MRSGGGELKAKTTLAVDEYIAGLAKTRAGEKRAYGLFLGTASHDSLPYFNSFRKIYTSVFDVKADVALTVYGEMDFKHIEEKFLKADLIYAGGGDTLFMLSKWREKGLLPLIKDAYRTGRDSRGRFRGGDLLVFGHVHGQRHHERRDGIQVGKGAGLARRADDAAL